MREKTYRPVKKSAMIIAVLLFAACVAFAVTAFHAAALLRETLDGRKAQVAQEHVTHFSLREQMMQSQADARIRGWLSVVHQEEIKLSTQRGMLCASLFEPIGMLADTPWALVFHGGLGTDRSQVLDVACELSLSGYRVLTPDLHAHGESEGEIASLGLADARDVQAWVQWIAEHDKDARIVLFGQDEGGVAALLAAAQGLPPCVHAIAADSAYRSIEERMHALLEREGQLDRTLLDAAYRMKHGVSADEGELTQLLEDCILPLLFIHGTGDAQVPAWHSEDLADAAKNAELLFVEGAAHGMARYAEPEKYYGALQRFYEQSLGI